MFYFDLAWRQSVGWSSLSSFFIFGKSNNNTLVLSNCPFALWRKGREQWNSYYLIISDDKVGCKYKLAIILVLGKLHTETMSVSLL